MEPRDRVAGVAVFAGGAGRRMGCDKMRLRIDDGPPLLERVVAVAAELAPAIVLGRERPGDWCGGDTQFLVDLVPGQGPLGGLVTGLAAFDGALIAVAGDMPMLRARDLRWLASRWDETPGRAGLVALRSGRPEPLFAVYTPLVLPEAERRLREGRRSLKGLVEALGLSGVEVPPDLAPRLANLNRPEDIDALGP